MPRYMLDTNIVIYIRASRPASVLRRLRELGPGDAVMSAISYGELRFGAEKSSKRDVDLPLLEALAETIPVQPLSVGAGQTYGRLRLFLSRRGEMIGPNDLWIAAHALASDSTLVTNNEREFRRVPDLRIENWASAA
jgi:tRNA(fMet)-specific endonuclease VapC